MKLPIYRKLDEPFKLMELKPFELGVVAGIFVLSAQLLGTTQYSLLFSLGGSRGSSRLSVGDSALDKR